MKRILFAGYAPVHFLCFRPVYERLRRAADVEVWLSGGARVIDGDETRYEIAGFYDPFGVDPARVAPLDDVLGREFDVAVCAHSSTDFVPPGVGATVQIFHGVSFKNFAVRDKVLKFDLACVPGRYHAERFAEQGLLAGSSTRFLMTGFPKLDALVAGADGRDALLRSLDLDPSLPAVLYAPTGGKHNSLDAMGEEILETLARDGRWNVLVKPHDHPKKAVDWFSVLAGLEGPRLRLIRDLDVIPWLRAADLLLTDASSVSMEYTLLDRPIVFVDVPKLLENVRKRGGALDLETYGRKIGRVAAAPADLPAAIADALAHPDREGELRRRAAKHLFHAPGHATENVEAVVRHAAGLAAELPEAVEAAGA